jgi:hypothetical protein
MKNNQKPSRIIGWTIVGLIWVFAIYEIIMMIQ